MDDETAGGPSGRAVEQGSVHVLLGSGKTRVVLAGEVDAALGEELLDASSDVLEAQRPVEVDAARVTFMDSTGIAFLARLASRSPEQLVLIKPPAMVRFLIDVTSIRQVLRVVDEDPGVDATAPAARAGHTDGADQPGRAAGEDDADHGDVPPGDVPPGDDAA